MIWQRLRTSPAAHFCLIVGFALLVRALHLIEVAESPFYRHVVEPDSVVYLEQGRAVADGDWLGSEAFKLSPLYRYLLGIILILGDGDVLWIRVVQSLLGSICCGITYLVGQRIWGAATGLVAGAVLALYGPAVFYESKIINEVWVITANLLAVLALLSYRKRPLARHLALCGLCLGLSSILRANGTMLTVLFALTAWLYQEKGDWQRRLTHFAAYAGGWLVAGLPVLLRNWLVAGQFVLLVTNLGPELYLGSHPDTPGVGFGVPHFIAPHPRTISEGFREQAVLETGEDVSYEEASRFWVGETLRTIVRRPGDYLRLLGRKFEVATNNFEATDNTVYEHEKKQSRVLAFSFVGFGLLLALAGTGAVLALRRDHREQLPLLAILLGYAASLVMVAIIARYRLPAAPIMALYAGVLLTALAKWIRGKRWLPPLACFWLFSALLGYAFHESPLVKEMKRERVAEAHYRLARIAQLEGRPLEALEMVQQAIDWFPEASEFYLIPGLPYDRKNPFEVAWARRKADIQHRMAPSREMVTCARVLEQGGSPEFAEKVLRRAIIFYWSYDSVLGELLGVLWRQGRRDAIQEVLREVKYTNPTSPAVAYYRTLMSSEDPVQDYFRPENGFGAMQAARIEFANRRFIPACRLLQFAWQRGFAHSAEANYLLGRCWSEIGDYGRAAEYLKLTAKLSPDYVRFAQYEGELNQIRASLRPDDPASRERFLQACLRAWRIEDIRVQERAEGETTEESVYPRLNATDEDFEPVR